MSSFLDYMCKCSYAGAGASVQVHVCECRCSCAIPLVYHQLYQLHHILDHIERCKRWLQLNSSRQFGPVNVAAAVVAMTTTKRCPILSGGCLAPGWAPLEWPAERP